jgi:hypothetical protein
MIKQPIVLDNALPQSYAEQIEETIFSPGNFPWYFVEDITSPDPNYSDQRTMGFSHVYMNNEVVTSDFYGLVSLIPEFCFNSCDLNYSYYKIINARSFLQIPQPNTKEYDNVHIDYLSPHIVCLYYVTDSDADTFIFGKTKKSELSLKVKPKKNRAVVFDGLTYHSSSNPNLDKRVIINFNLITK